MKDNATGRTVRKSTSRVATALGLLALIAGGGATDAQAQECDDVSGDWSVDLTFPGAAPQTVTVTLEQTECAVTGMVKGNNETPIEDGTVEGSTFRFSTTVDGGGQMITIAWEGTIEGDDVSGTLSADPIGVVEFSGKRVE